MIILPSGRVIGVVDDDSYDSYASYDGLWCPDAPMRSVPVHDPGEDLECPKPGCQRPKPFENKDGRLECWWCGFTGGWYDFPRRKEQGA